MPRLPAVGIGDGDDQRDIGRLSAGDELLGAVEHVAVAPAGRPRADRRRVRSPLRLGQGEGRELAAARQIAHVALLLDLGAVGQDRHDAHGVVPAHHRRKRPVAGRDLLQRQRIGDVVGTRPAPLGGHRHAHEPQRAQLLKDAGRKGCLLLPFRRVWRQPRLRKLARALLDEQLLLAEDHVRPLAVLGWRRPFISPWMHRVGTPHGLASGFLLGCYLGKVRTAVLEDAGRRQAAGVGFVVTGIRATSGRSRPPMRCRAPAFLERFPAPVPASIRQHAV